MSFDQLIAAINNSLDFINTMIGFVGGFLSATYLEYKRKIDKRRALLMSLFEQLSAYDEPEDIHLNQVKPGYGTPYRGSTFWEIINSDVLDQKKDRELIRLIHEMIGWIENYNAINNLANLSMITTNCNPEIRTELMQGRHVLAVKSFKDIEALKTLLKTKYIKEVS